MSAAERFERACALVLVTVAATLILALFGWLAMGGTWGPTPAEDLRGLACWLEPNPSQPQGVEEVCGPHSLMPEGATLTVAGDDSPCWAEEGVSCGPAQVDPSDGRVAPCGVVTEDGVTEHLDAYEERCGPQAGTVAENCERYTSGQGTVEICHGGPAVPRTPPTAPPLALES